MKKETLDKAVAAHHEAMVEEKGNPLEEAALAAGFTGPFTSEQLSKAKEAFMGALVNGGGHPIEVALNSLAQMNADTIIYLPALIRGGQEFQQWTGPLGELVELEKNSWGTVVEELRLTEEFEKEEFDLRDHLYRFTIETVRHLTDDPNAEVSSI